MKLRPIYLVFAGLVFLSTILFVRTTGIHIDENNYLDAAVNSRLGDSKGSGKPPLFYWMNYKLQHEIARSLGPLKPVTIYLFYIAAFSATLVWALRPAFGDNSGYLALTFFVLLLSPLALLNTTQLMMETAMLPVVSLLFGSVLRGGDSFWKLLRIFLVSLLLILLKATGIAAVVLLAAVTVRRTKWITVALGTGALSGYLVNAATLRWIIQMEHATDYGGPSEILNIAAAWARLTSQDIYVWLFFVGIGATAGGLAYAHSRWRSGKAKSDRKWQINDGALLILAFGTLAFTLLMQSISIYGFARYNYPTLWLGLIASVLLVARHRAIALLPLAALFFIQSSSLWGTDLNRFNSWPNRTVVEFMESGGTILMAAPIHRLVVEQHFRDSSPCYAVESMNPQEESYYLQYFVFAFPKGRVAASSACDPTIRIWRDPVETVGSCPARCESSNKWHGCGYQNLVFYTFRQGLALNQVCW